MLREGNVEGWGYRHIFETRADGINHADQIRRKFGLTSDEQVIDLIQEAIKNGEYRGINSKGFHEIIYNKNGKKIEVVISATESPGSIQSAYPIS